MDDDWLAYLLTVYAETGEWILPMKWVSREEIEEMYPMDEVQ